MVAKRREGFAGVTHRLLVVEKMKPVADAARALGMKYATLHARIIGRIPFRPAEVNALIRELYDLRLADCLLANTSFMAVPRPKVLNARRNAGLMRDAIDAVAQSVGVLREVERDMNDGRIDRAARARIEAQVLAAERAFAILRSQLALMGTTAHDPTPSAGVEV